MTGRLDLNLVVLVPVYNDWESATWLAHRLDDVLRGQSIRARLVLVDDCSQCTAPSSFAKTKPTNLTSVETIRLRRNLGHQRAIAIGLSYVNEHSSCDAVLIMDVDGEDKPEDIPLLITRFREENASKVVFAKRTRRSEGWVFRLGYVGYRWAHRLLTGAAVRVGNFSVVPARHLGTLVGVSETWNHYAASVLKSRIPYCMVAAGRGKRFTGQSKMDLVALVLHGLSAISVFAETVGVRLTFATLGMVGVLAGLLLSVIVVRLNTEIAIPGWATTAGGLLLVIMLQMLTVVFGLTLLVLFNRNNLSFLPLRDYKFFVAEHQTLYRNSSASPL